MIMHVFHARISSSLPDMIKPATRANLVRGQLFEKCQNNNKSKTNHTFLEQIDHIEGRKFKIIDDLLHMFTFWYLSSPTFSLIGNLFPKKVRTVQIRKIWFVDIFRLFSCLITVLSLSNHTKEHNTQKCAECATILPSVNDLNKHIKNVHAVQCIHCPETLKDKNPYSSMRHLRSRTSKSRRN